MTYPFERRRRPMKDVFLLAAQKGEPPEHLLLSPENLKSLAPKNRLALHARGGESHFSLKDTSNEAVADYAVLYDPASGLYRADIHTTARAHEWHSRLHAKEMFFSGNTDRKAYVIEKLMIDNVSINLEDPQAVAEAMTVFRAYIGACPEIGGEIGAFPIPSAQQRSRLPRTPKPKL